MVVALLLAVALAPQDEDLFAYGNALIRVPEGWKADPRDEGLFLRPGDLQKDESFVVIFPPGGTADVNLAAGFEKTWKQVAGTRTVAKKAPEKEIKTDGGIDGLLSVGLLDDADNVRMIAAVALFKPADRFQAVLALTTQDHVYQRYSEPFRLLWKGLRFRNVELPAYDLLLSMGYSKSEGRTTVYVLFRDGICLTMLPINGLDRMESAAAIRQHAALVGSHETKDGVLTVRVGSRVETLKPQLDGSFRSVENGQFLKIATSTGLRLDGKFVLHGGTTAIVFRPDGTFDDERGKPGAYEIYNNTLYLSSADKNMKRMSFMILPAAKVEFIYLKSAWYRRE